MISKLNVILSFGILDATKNFVFALYIDVYPNKKFCSLCDELLLLKAKNI